MFSRISRNSRNSELRRASFGVRAALLGAVVVSSALAAPRTAAQSEGPANINASIIRVAPSGNDAGGCGSEAAPCKTIAFAVNQAASGDEIRVAAGTYTDTGPDSACSGFTNAVVCVNGKALTVRGGFSTGNWSSPSPTANATVIDGQNVNRGVNVVLANRLTMEGFTIQNGRAQGPEGGDPNTFGGGVSVLQGVVTLRDMVFRNNQAIGQNSTSGIGAAGAGSAVTIRNSPSGVASVLERLTVQDNTSTGGAGSSRGGFAFGAVFIFGSSVNIASSTFTGNRALAGSGGTGSSNGLADALGGAIAVQGGSTVNVSGVQATNNEVIGGNGSQFGGGGFGGAIMTEDSSITLTDSSLRSNVVRGGNGSASGGYIAGGGMLSFNSSANISRVHIIANRMIGGNASSGGNAGTGGGGGLYLWRSRSDAPGTVNVTNAIIADNSVEMGQGKNVGGGGGGIQAQGLTANLTHVTLARNRLGSGLVVGQALAVVEAPGVSATTVNFNHSIVADHTENAGATAVVVLKGNTINFNRGLFANNTNNTNGNFDPIEPGVINGLSTLTGAPSAGFASPGSPNFNYRLTSGSEAIDKAIGSATPDDFEGQPRPVGQAPDLGADEFGAAIDPGNLSPRAYFPIIAK